MRERIYYEIAMSIGNSLDLGLMLKQGLSTYLRKLNGLAGAVLQQGEDESGNISFKTVYAIPRRMRRNSAVREGLEQVPHCLSPEQLTAYLSELPLQDDANGLKRYLMELPGFGLLLLVKSAPGLSIPELKSLAPLNAKLADACAYCVSNTRLQQEIREREVAEEKYRAIFNHSVSGIFQSSLDGHLLEANQAMASILGYDSPSQLMSEVFNVEEQFYVDPNVRGLHLSELEKHGKVSGFEIEYYRKDQTVGWMSVSSRLVSDAEGLPLYIEGVLEDVTPRKQAMLALREAKKEAERLSKLKSNFISMVSHELRTPLTSILGFTKIIRKRISNVLEQAGSCPNDVVPRLERVVSNTEIVTAEGERLTELINNVLDLAKLESGWFEWNLAIISLKDVLTHSIAATEILFTDKKLKVVQNIQGDLPVVFADRDRLVQVVINLLSNAFKFTEIGSVTVSASVVEDVVLVSVADTGLGVTESESDIIFDKFRQLGNDLTDKPKGTGLGLPICQEIIEYHKGHLWYEPGENGGSVFSFTIPLKND